MSRIVEGQWVAGQYQNATDLNARIQLHQRFGTNSYGWQRWVFDHFAFAAPSRLLEIGCGPGTLWRENSDRLASEVAAGWSLILSDLSPGMVAQAQHNLRGLDAAICFNVCDAQALPLADGSLDGVIANHMLYHVPNLDQALAEIRRVLRPGGSLLAATNGAQHMHEFRSWVRRAASEQGVAADLWSLGQFTFESGQAALESHFEEVELHRYENPLVVTDVEPLVAYAMSLSDEMADGTHVAGFRRLVEQEMAAKGRIEITTAAGIFEARRRAIAS